MKRSAGSLIGLLWKATGSGSRAKGPGPHYTSLCDSISFKFGFCAREAKGGVCTQAKQNLGELCTWLRRDCEQIVKPHTVGQSAHPAHGLISSASTSGGPLKGWSRFAWSRKAVSNHEKCGERSSRLVQYTHIRHPSQLMGSALARELFMVYYAELGPIQKF